MDDLAKQVVMGLPNFAIAVWVIWQYQLTISRLLENQQKLIERLMNIQEPASTPEVGL